MASSIPASFRRIAQGTQSMSGDWNGQRMVSTYDWREDRSVRITAPIGAQATSIVVMQRRRRLRGAQWEDSKFVCKYYSFAGRETNNIGGLKYVKRELDILKQCHHPNIVRYADFAYEPTGARLAQIWTEYCPGGDLRQFETNAASRASLLSRHECAQVFRQLAQALLYLHHGVFKSDAHLSIVSAAALDVSAGGNAGPNSWRAIFHRDIKPANVFVTQRARGLIHVKLGDFGISKLEADGTLTEVNTNAFAAPEVKSGNPGGIRFTIKSDIFSLGRTIRRIFQQNQSVPREVREVQLNHIIRSLISSCTQRVDESRPTSIEVIDTLKPLLEPRRPMLMIYDAANSFLMNPDRNPTTNGSSMQLCQRLRVAGKPQYDEAMNKFLRIVQAIGKGDPIVNNATFLLTNQPSESTQMPSSATLRSRGFTAVDMQLVQSLGLLGCILQIQETGQGDDSDNEEESDADGEEGNTEAEAEEEDEDEEEESSDEDEYEEGGDDDEGDDGDEEEDNGVGSEDDTASPLPNPANNLATLETQHPNYRQTRNIPPQSTARSRVAVPSSRPVPYVIPPRAMRHSGLEPGQAQQSYQTPRTLPASAAAYNRNTNAQGSPSTGPSRRPLNPRRTV